MLIAERLYCQWLLTQSEYPVDYDKIVKSSDKNIEIYFFRDSAEQSNWLHVFEDKSVLMNTVNYWDNSGSGTTRWFKNIIAARELLYSNYPKIMYICVLNGPEKPKEKNHGEYKSGDQNSV